MDWKDVRGPDDVIDVGKKKFPVMRERGVR